MRKFVLSLVILAALSSLVWFGQRGSSAAVGVDVALVDHGVLAETTVASGSLVFAEQIQLRSEVSGRVAEVRVVEGQRVKRGELLMRLDPDAFEADVSAGEAGARAAALEVRSRRARMADLGRQLARQHQLLARELIGRDAFEQLQAQHQIAELAVMAGEQALLQAQAQRELALERLQRSRFVAPIDGLMISVDVKPGETVVPGTLNIIGSDLMVLADPSVLLAELRVDEADIAQLELGQRVQVFAASHPQSPLMARVVHIGTSARSAGNGQSLSFRVRAQLDPTDQALHPGMSVRAEIETASGRASLHVPIAALRRDEAGHHVWRVDAQGRAERVAVEAGMANDFSQAVSGGLAQGERVIVGPGRVLAQLRAGEPVRLRETDA